MKTSLRRLIANFAKANGSPEVAGDTGELFAIKWFEMQGIEYYRFPQSQESMPRGLATAGGKRPDFALSGIDDDSLIYVDAKFHQTKNVTEFSLRVSEIEKYYAFKGWMRAENIDCGNLDVFFMLFPKELGGDRFTLIHLIEFNETGWNSMLNGEPARSISLTDRTDLWVDFDAEGASYLDPAGSTAVNNASVHHASRDDAGDA